MKIIGTNRIVIDLKCKDGRSVYLGPGLCVWSRWRETVYVITSHKVNTEQKHRTLVGKQNDRKYQS